MTTVATKHKHRAPGTELPPGTRLGPKGTLMDDMDARTSAEIPQRRSKSSTEGHSVVFGMDDCDAHYKSLKNRDFQPKQHSAAEREKARAEQLGRITDMNTKHFVFGHHPLTMMSELRGTLLPPTKEVLTSREIRPIGGPNNKGASNLFVSDRDRSDWGTNMVSTTRQDFKFDRATHSTSLETKDSTARHIKHMRSSHFNVGHDRSEWSSTVQTDYVAMPEGRAESVPPKGSSVPLASGAKGRRPSDFVSVNRGNYGAGAAAAGTPPPAAGHVLPRIRDLQRTHMVLGYDARELRTENKAQFKRATFVAAGPGRPPPATFSPARVARRSPARAASSPPGP